jgi:hypothetical protein
VSRGGTAAGDGDCRAGAVVIRQVISGWQTGADQAGMRAARAVGLPTGGYIPKGYRTEEGPRPDFAPWGAIQSTSNQYAPCTINNLKLASVVIWFGTAASSGGRLTLGDACTVPWIVIDGPSPTAAPESLVIADLIEFVRSTSPTIVMVAGNRESRYPGIGAFVERILTQVFRELQS